VTNTTSGSGKYPYLTVISILVGNVRYVCSLDLTVIIIFGSSNGK
jgi:hypothetical protein